MRSHTCTSGAQPCFQLVGLDSDFRFSVLWTGSTKRSKDLHNFPAAHFFLNFSAPTHKLVSNLFNCGSQLLLRGEGSCVQRKWEGLCGVGSCGCVCQGDLYDCTLQSWYQLPFLLTFPIWYRFCTCRKSAHQHCSNYKYKWEKGNCTQTAADSVHRAVGQ